MSWPRSLVLVLAALAPQAGRVAWAAPPPPQLQIEADATAYDGKDHTYQVRGHVRITLPQMVVTCEQATIYAAPTEDRVLRVVFAGGVEARRGSDTFRAARITYHVPERRLVAEGATRTRILLPAGAAGPLSGP
jgi:lipopolysaccharide export system protein LptA